MAKRRSKPTKSSKLIHNINRTILQFVEGKRYEPMSGEKLLDALAIAPVNHDLFKEVLADLVLEGTLSLHRGTIFLPKSKEKLITGTISVHHKGFGFVKATEGPDVFIPKHLVGDAVDGDTVEVEVASVVSAKGPEGAVITVLQRSKTHLACTVIEKNGHKCTGYSPLLGKEKPISIKNSDSLQVGDRIICLVSNWKGSDNLVHAEMTRLIGHISDPSIDIDAAIEEFELPYGFSSEAIAEAKTYGAKISTKEAKGRLDLCGEECVTIDPDTAKDYDDAITLTKDEKGNYHLGVHIADVAHYVAPGTHLDAEAFLRCNSTYFPGKCVPMLPEELSNELCSLKPKVKRLAMSVLAEFNKNGDLVDYKIARTVIKSVKRFTYKEALSVIEKKKKSPHADLLDRMIELCLLFKKKRFERGSIDFSLSEDVIIVDEKGSPQKLERVEYDITHQMIEEFMLKANELTAIHLANQGKILIYRIHEEPTAESFQDFYTFARSLGFILPEKPTHKDIQTLFQEAKDSPFLAQLSVSFIRSMKLAQYSPENIGHYGLALDHYCHFTSPIRRYTDLIIQRLLMNELPEDTELETVAKACSDKERVSFKAESSVKLLKKLRLAKTHFDEDPSRIYPAIITRVKPFALFFEVETFDLESTLHVSEIGNDYFEFNQSKLQFTGKRTGKVFASGQTIYVRLDKIDFILQEAKWSPADQPDTRRASGTKKAPRKKSHRPKK
jgi:ribonuclease R